MNEVNYKQIEEKLENQYKSKLVFARNVEIKTLGDILRRLYFSSIDMKRDTYRLYNDGSLKKQSTGHRRSIQDAYLIAKNYIPNIRYEEVEKAAKFFHTRMPGEYGKPQSNPNYCPTVRRTVHCTSMIHTYVNVNSWLDSAGLNKTV